MKIVFDKTAIDTNMQFKQVLMIVDFNIWFFEFVNLLTPSWRWMDLKSAW